VIHLTDNQSDGSAGFNLIVLVKGSGGFGAAKP